MTDSIEGHTRSTNKENEIFQFYTKVWGKRGNVERLPYQNKQGINRIDWKEGRSRVGVALPCIYYKISESVGMSSTSQFISYKKKAATRGYVLKQKKNFSITKIPYIKQNI